MRLIHQGGKAAISKPYNVGAIDPNAFLFVQGDFGTGGEVKVYVSSSPNGPWVTLETVSAPTHKHLNIGSYSYVYAAVTGGDNNTKLIVDIIN